MVLLAWELSTYQAPARLDGSQARRDFGRAAVRVAARITSESTAYRQWQIPSCRFSFGSQAPPSDCSDILPSWLPLERRPSRAAAVQYTAAFAAQRSCPVM